MPNDIIPGIEADDLLGIRNASIAIANENQKIVWYNQTFKEDIGGGRIKGNNFITMFSIPENIFHSNKKSKKTFSHPLPNINFTASINSISSKAKTKKQPGYLIELIPSGRDEGSIDIDTEVIGRNVAFLNELEELLVLLVKENSLDKISNQIILKCAKISMSGFGIVIFHNNNEKNDFLFHDPHNIIKNKGDAGKAIDSDLSFLNKWLHLNKKSLIALNQQGNIGFNLTEILNCESLIISPCFFEEELLATIIVGKTTGRYSAFEINIVEQLSALISFTISNIKTKELNTALENRLLQAQKLETIGKLSSGMAHDFSNLLSSIFGSLHLLRKRVPANEDTNRLIDNIENCSIRARDLTKGLLSFGKPTPKRKELVKPNQLISEISKVISQTFPKTISFTENSQKGLYDILGNSTEIYQILLNLCVNARDATNEKGSIKLSAENITINDRNIVNHPLLEKRNYVRISVEDDGEGIDEENLQKIFDPYFSTKTKEQGSGLGLYVSYGIIKAHKGLIDVTSDVNKGTRFDVYIPSYEPLKEKKPASTDKIILLADDEEMLSDLLAELLESKDYNVIKVSSGKEALKVLTEEIKVDLAIIDYNMPELSGLETIEKIRKLNFNLPVILSSGATEQLDGIDLNKYKISSSIHKPYEFDTMLSAIQKFI
ncbi:MAG: ATP-binding protein [Ignavibacteria bacterium]|nr:ATP-binding protein [Ignavibacteria bacterium]